MQRHFHWYQIKTQRESDAGQAEKKPASIWGTVCDKLQITEIKKSTLDSSMMVYEADIELQDSSSSDVLEEEHKSEDQNVTGREKDENRDDGTRGEEEKELRERKERQRKEMRKEKVVQQRKERHRKEMRERRWYRRGRRERRRKRRCYRRGG